MNTLIDLANGIINLCIGGFKILCWLFIFAIAVENATNGNCALLIGLILLFVFIGIIKIIQLTKNRDGDYD